MSLVVNMQQRRTVAAGRQNQDPNKDGEFLVCFADVGVCCICGCV
jgi:hypothetical protein